MTELIVCLSNENLPHIERLIKDGDWEKVILITDESGKKKTDLQGEFIIVDFSKPIFDIIDNLKQKLKEKVSGVEVGVNLVSGSGKEHMAIMSSLLKLGIGFRFVAVTKEGIKEI